MTHYEELYLHVLDLQEDIDLFTKELQYMGDFLSQMGLWDEYVYFRTNARLEKDEDEPFPRYVL